MKSTAKIRKYFDAIKYGKEDLIYKMLKEGIHIDTQDKFGRTALMVAARQGYLTYPHDLTEAMIILKLWLAGANSESISNLENKT